MKLHLLFSLLLVIPAITAQNKTFKDTLEHTVVEYHMLKGKLNGSYISRDLSTNKILAQGQMFNNQRTGLWEIYDLNGNKVYQRTYNESLDPLVTFPEGKSKNSGGNLPHSIRGKVLSEVNLVLLDRNNAPEIFIQTDFIALLKDKINDGSIKVFNGFSLKEELGFDIIEERFNDTETIDAIHLEERVVMDTLSNTINYIPQQIALIKEKEGKEYLLGYISYKEAAPFFQLLTFPMSQHSYIQTVDDVFKYKYYYLSNRLSLVYWLEQEHDIWKTKIKSHSKG